MVRLLGRSNRVGRSILGGCDGFSRCISLPSTVGQIFLDLPRKLRAQEHWLFGKETILLFLFSVKKKGVTIAEDVNDMDRDQQIEDKTKAGSQLFVVQALTSLFFLLATAYVFF